MSAGKKVYVKTFGCQMNVYDSERMLETLAARGYSATDIAEDADLVLLNTCHIREKAAEKVYSDAGRMRNLKEDRERAGKSTLIAVAGCVAQAEGDEMVRRQPAIDLVVGPQSYHRFGELLDEVRSSGRSVVATDFPTEHKFAALPDRFARAGASAFLTVQEGCDKFCSFCVVPYTRGAEYSRPVADLEAEARRLVELGAREIVLLGQNVNAYHGSGPDGRPWSLAQLIDRLAKLHGLERIRYTTSHPLDMAEDLISAHRDQAKLMPFLHLPLQAGSDRVLARMNRKHTSAQYLDLAARIRAARPDIALSTDIIVGFPGETDEDFQDTVAMLERVRFAQAYSFKYSPRPGTPAAAMPQLPEEVKEERLRRVQETVTRHQSAFNASSVGGCLPVLFERRGRHPGQFVGRSPYLQSVHAQADESVIGRIRDVEITGAGPNSLSGTLTSAA